MKKKIFVFLLFVISGFLLRFHNYYLFPVFGETADEWAWSHLGASLIQDGIPTSWSFFEEYKNGYIYKEGIYQAPIVRPVFDHPPLFSLLPGTVHSVKGHWLDFPSSKAVRFPMIILGAINVGLFWLLADKFFKNKKLAVFASVLFMTIPTLVFGSRIVVAENLLVTWAILAFYALLSPNKKWSLKLIFIVSLFSILTKVSGVVIPASIIAFAFAEKNWSLLKTSLLGLFSGIILFVLYGAFYDFGLFVKMLSAQSSRGLGLVTLQNRLFLHPTVIRHFFFDGWKMLGIFSSFFVLLQKKKKYLFLQISFLMHLAFILFAVEATTFHGWYDYFLWPTLIINIVILLSEIYEKRLFLLSAFKWFLLLPLFNLIVFEKFELGLWATRAIVAFGFLPFLFETLNLKKLSKKTFALILIIIVISNVAVIIPMEKFKYWHQAEFFTINLPRTK